MLAWFIICKCGQPQTVDVVLSEMTVFSGCQIALELGIKIPFKRKQQVRKAITENGGVVSFIITKKVRVLTYKDVYTNVGNMNL